MCIIKLVVSKVYTIDSALLKKTAITAKTQLVDFYLLNLGVRGADNMCMDQIRTKGFRCES